MLLRGWRWLASLPGALLALAVMWWLGMRLVTWQARMQTAETWGQDALRQRNLHEASIQFQTAELAAARAKEAYDRIQETASTVREAGHKRLASAIEAFNTTRRPSSPTGRQVHPRGR